MRERPCSRRRRRLHALSAMLSGRRRRTHLAVCTRPPTSPALSRHDRVRRPVRAFGAMVFAIGCLGSTGLLAATRASAVTPGNAAVAPTFGATISSSTVAWTGVIATFRLGSSGPVPAITSVSPSHGTDGTAVTIAGSGFSNGTSSVTFNGTSASFSVTGDTQINTRVPAGATTGPVKVATLGGTATSSTAFKVDPAITGFSPTSGSVGASVTITGSGFTGATKVVFHTTNQPTFTVSSDSRITTTVPTGATSGPISVTTPANTATSSTSFMVTPHVMLIVEENQEYSSIIGSSNAPYINQLAKAYATATKWYAVQHNSPTDYMELLSGSNQGWPVTAKAVTAPTLVDELHAKSTPIPWKAYMENMPSTPTCTTATDPTGLYDVIHNPFRYFTRYTTNSGGWCSSANLSTEGVLRYPGSSGLLSALNGTNAPDFVWITPNNCHNMHGDTSTGSGCATSTHAQLVKAGDSWLSNNIAYVISSKWFSQNGIIIITWDEGTTNAGCCKLSAPGGHISTIVVTTNNAGLGSFTGTGDHYGTLAAIEKAYGVSRLLNSANAINGDLTGAFGP
jgi:Phosphoesterase family/IPT/TIG domain